MKGVFFLALLFLAPAYSYRFLCNGITAEGQQETDSCTQPCLSAPTHWPYNVNNTVTYNVGTSVLPSGVSASSWLSVVQSCFTIWNQTPGALLMATYGSSGPRSFGTDSNNHDIYFVASEEEWSSKVGAAPNGVLGVTLPPYACPTSTVPYRRIDDADMILNAVPKAGFVWAPGCPQLSDDCQSARATVAHESGHFLGLGHPCASCQELMSAQAEFLIEYPLFDDQQGLAALYPAGGSTVGAFGTDCSSASCKSDLTCHAQGTSKYCSHGCTLSPEAAPCENHMVCNTTNGYCEFPSGTQLGAVSLYEDCTRNPCDIGLTCVGISDTAAYCFNDCTASQTCASSETCHQLSNSRHVKINSYACMQLVGQGQSCGIINGVPIVCQSGQGLTCLSDTSKCVSSSSLGSGNLVVGGGTGATDNSSCSSVRAPTETGLLWVLLGILVHRPKKKC